MHLYLSGKERCFDYNAGLYGTTVKNIALICIEGGHDWMPTANEQGFADFAFVLVQVGQSTELKSYY